MKPVITILFTLISFVALGQELTTIRVSVPNNTDEVYIVGNQDALGNWTPDKVRMNRNSDYEREISLKLNFPAEFKFTRGSWHSEAVINSLNTGGETNLKLTE